MSLDIVGIPMFSCSRCSAPLRASEASTPLARIVCTECGQMTSVPARLGDMTLLARVGRHPAGDLFEAKEDLSGRLMSVLVCHPPQERWREVVDATVEVHRRLALASGQQLVRIYRIGFMEEHPVIVSEPHIPSLLQLSRRNALPKAKIRSLASSVVNGLRQAERAGLAHMGLHAGSVLMRPEGLRVFGFSPWNILPKAPGGKWENLYPRGWVPPEVLAGHKPDRQSDIWSVGALLVFLATHRPPNPAEAPALTLGRLRPDLSRNFTDSVRFLMEQDPSKRPLQWRSVLDLLQPGSEKRAADPLAPLLAGGESLDSGEFVGCTLEDSAMDSRGVPLPPPPPRSTAASEVMGRIRAEEEVLSTMSGLSRAKLESICEGSSATGYDRISSLAIDDQEAMTMAADEMAESKSKGPADLMAKRVSEGRDADNA